MTVRLTPEAEAGLGEIFAWYSERGTDLGLDFVSSFTDVLGQIDRFPRSSPKFTTASGAIETVGDLNGDGRPEAVVTEGGTYCYGNAGTGFTLVSKQADGTWKAIHSATGMVSFLTTKGADGWPDLELGGPGFCFPVLRWDDREYRVQRHEYEGKPCRSE